MMKKTIALCICSLCVLLLVFGFWLGDSPASAEVSEEATGVFGGIDANRKTMTVQMKGTETSYPLASSVWVYRDGKKAALADLQAGDTLEIILNGKGQAAYVKAIGPSAASASAPSASPGGSEAPAAIAGAALPSPPPAGLPASSAPALPPAAAAGKAVRASSDAAAAQAKPGPAWKELELALRADGFRLEAKQEVRPGESKGWIYIDAGHHSRIKLDGKNAEQLLEQLLAGIDLTAADAKLQVQKRLAEQFGLTERKLSLKLEVKGLPVPASLASLSAQEKMAHDEHDDDDDKDRSKGSGGENGGRKSDKSD